MRCTDEWMRSSGGCASRCMTIPQWFRCGSAEHGEHGEDGENGENPVWEPGNVGEQPTWLPRARQAFLFIHKKYLVVMASHHGVGCNGVRRTTKALINFLVRRAPPTLT